MLLSLIATSPKMDAVSGGANRACEPALAAVREANWTACTGSRQRHKRRVRTTEAGRGEGRGVVRGRGERTGRHRPATGWKAKTLAALHLHPPKPHVTTLCIHTRSLPHAASPPDTHAPAARGMQRRRTTSQKHAHAAFARRNHDTPRVWWVQPASSGDLESSARQWQAGHPWANAAR